MKYIYALMASLLIFMSGVLLSKYYYEYTSEPEVITHEQELAMCEALDLEYDYEAEGTTAFELCYEPDKVQP